MAALRVLGPTLLLIVVGTCLTRAGDPRLPLAEPDQAAGTTDVMGLTLLDLDGAPQLLGGRDGTRPAALVFLGTECPISNRKIPQLNRMAKRATAQGVQFFGVLSDPFLTRAEAVTYRKTYKVQFPLLFDGSTLLARRLRPTHVPTAFLVGVAGTLHYRGAIDDGWDRPTRPRLKVRHTYLADAIVAVAQGKRVPVARTKAVGCVLQPPREHKPTFTRDVAPLLAAHCVECHRKGAVAPFALTSYKDAARRAKFLAQVSHDRLMPPWPPKAGFGSFLNERRLRTDEIKLLDAWSKAGAPRGNAADLPPPQRFATGWRLGKPDLVLTMEPYDIPAEGDDVFRCFVLPTKFLEDRQVIGFEFRPGAPRVVHHAIAFLDDTGQGRRLDARSPGPGYVSFGGIGFAPSGAVGGWAPGAQPDRFPAGVARYVKKGSDIILQVHYHPSGKVERDKSQVALFLAPKGAKNAPLRDLMMGTAKIDIPPGEKNYRRSSRLTLPAPVTVRGIAPHMHYLGRMMKVWAVTPAKKTIPLIAIEDWDFRWQGSYLYKRPVQLPKGTVVHLEASYDNSADNPDNPSDPPRRVKFGEQTHDEMCFCFLTVTTKTLAQFHAIQRQTHLELLRER